MPERGGYSVIVNYVGEVFVTEGGLPKVPKAQRGTTHLMRYQFRELGRDSVRVPGVENLTGRSQIGRLQVGRR